MARKPVICGWSGGKDSALMVYALRQSSEYEPKLLLTTLTEPFRRISMHGVRYELLQAQAELLGMELVEVWIPWPCPNEVYEERMREACESLKARGFSTFAFGDLYLGDIRAYRERNVQALGMEAIFPLWQQDTSELAHRFIAEGFKARLCCVDGSQIPFSLAGREYDATLLADLPPTADPCGENGEFHTFVYAGPLFPRAIPCAPGEVVIRDERFAYADLNLEKTPELCT